MDLSRESIERADFPRASDGLDPEAVAAHLRAVADAVEKLSRPGAAATPSSGERVRAIVDAAERSAAELEASARGDADRIRAEARADLERLRQLAAEIGDRALAVAGELEERAAAPVAPAPAQPPPPEPAEPQPAEPQPEPAGQSSGAAKAGAGEAPRSAAGEAPRLIALNMVLDGASREQVAQYLDENFDLEDPGELLDEVWSSAGG